MILYKSKNVQGKIGGELDKNPSNFKLFKKETYENRYDCIFIYNDSIENIHLVDLYTDTSKIQLSKLLKNTQPDLFDVSSTVYKNYNYSSNLNFNHLELKPNEFITIWLKLSGNSNKKYVLNLVDLKVRYY